MQVLHGFWRILQATSFMFVVGLLSINHAFAADISIFNWTANVDNSTVSGVARCGPKSGATSTGVKSWVTSNWTNQTGGCFCRVVGIDDVSDWNNLDDAGSNWYGSGTNFSGGFEECSQNCAATCAQKFESDDYYQENICGGTCPVVSPVGTQYTINYDMDGGTGCETVQTYTESATICEPTREGYTFDGWMDNNTSETYSGGDVVYNVNLDLVAFWTEIPGTRYTILYDTNGGTGCADTEYVISTTLCTPSREAYHFDGWVDADTQNIYNGGATVSDIDLILTAQWTFVGCANGQYFENNVCNTCVSGYTSDGATATSQNDCYRSCTTDDIDNSTAVDGTYYYDGTNTCNATSCYTGWHVNGTTCEIDTYTIVYNSNGGTEYTDGSYTIESDTITLPVPVRDGYEFDGWYDNADFYGSPITEITYGSTGNKEYHAKWIKLPCNNNYYGDGFVCDTCPVAYPNSDNTDNNDITRCYAIVDYTNYCAPGVSCYSVPSSKRYYYSSENPDAYIVKNLFTPSNTDDYTFGGWYLNDEYNGDEIINGSTLSGNLILYGKWDEILTTEWGCRVGEVTADADSWSEDIKEVGTDIPSAESLRSATGIVTRAGNDGSYILNYQDQQDYQTNLDRYLTGEEFYVTWGNTTIRGWAGCSANTWNTDKPNYSSQTLTFTNAGCGCSIDKERWIVKRNLLTQNGATWDEKNEYCRANCPAACANAVANDYAFRTALFNGQCPEARQMYTITYHLNADNAHFENENNIPRTYTAESDSIALPIPQRDEYEFYGWYDNAELSGEAITTIVSGSTGDREYWAKWAQNPETYCNNQGTPYYWNGSTCVNAETECVNQGQYFSWDSENNTCIYDEESECTDNGDVWDVDTCITHDEYCEANYGDNYVWNGESCEQAAFECTSGKWLHLGDNAKLCLSETKPVSHESPVVLKVQVGNDVYYLSATPGAEYLPVNEDATGVKMKMYYKGRTYNVHDESISVF